MGMDAVATHTVKSQKRRNRASIIQYVSLGKKKREEFLNEKPPFLPD